jgi:hypothetical protein
VTHLRRIACHIDEPDPGHFYWFLMEEGDDASQWVELESADEPYTIWLDALNAGVQALAGYEPDKRMGPRTSGDDEDGGPGRMSRACRPARATGGISPTLTTCGVQRTASGAHVRHSSQPRSAVHAHINEIGAMPPCHILQITNQKL